MYFPVVQEIGDVMGKVLPTTLRDEFFFSASVDDVAIFMLRPQSEGLVCDANKYSGVKGCFHSNRLLQMAFIQ